MYWCENDQRIKEVDFFEAVNKTYNEKPLIKLPLYQRDAVWSEGRVCALWDSILRGFPLPLFLLVKGKGNSRPSAQDRMRAKTDTDAEKDYFDLLDGQQRMIAISHGVMPGNTSTVRLWLDLAPSDSKEKPHPYKYKYWLHPCTNVFPFGFRMEKSGEHDFTPLHDAETREIRKKLQSDLKDKDFYQIPLTESFPWHANCPVPLDEIIGLIRNKNTTLEGDALKAEILKVAEKSQENIKADVKNWQPPDNRVVEAVEKALMDLRNRKLAFQLIELNNDEEDDDYTLFERIGRGGVQISQRQLAVSKLMLVLGAEGNDAIAMFQKTKWGSLLETEDVVHALARIAYAKTQIKPENISEHFVKELSNWDMFDLNIDRLNTMKKDNELWTKFSEELKFLCDSQRLHMAFNNLFNALQFDPATNKNGFPLVQLAQTNRPGEGISPITLHPLLLWLYNHDADSLPEKNHSEDMLRWIMFANGISGNPKHERLNREVFWQVFDSGRLDFSRLKSDVFEDTNLARDIGFVSNPPKIDSDGNVSPTDSVYKDVPTPDEIVELFIRRLILQNWAADGVSKFVLMWNQRAALHAMYGDTDMKHLPALFSKGRPFDLDHIVARNRVLYSPKEVINDESLLAGVQVFFKQPDILKKSILKRDCFRKNLPNMNANYRYWPKHLNRADQDCVVKEKMPLDRIKKNSENHPLSKIFDGKQDTVAWEWSLLEEDKSDWECLPPEDYNWNAELIAKFIRVISRRQYYLYANAYQFLIPNYELNLNFNPDGIIGNEG